MPAFKVHSIPFGRIALGAVLALTAMERPCPADKPTGVPLELSTIETEQAVPLAFLGADGKTAHCAEVRLHWNPNPTVGPDDDATSFELDEPSDSPGASIFITQLWNASLSAAMAWQQPWQGARWKVFQAPLSNGTGIDAGLAVGMIATSARRPYPPKTVVIGCINPDGSLGPVSHLLERIDAASAAGMTRAIIPSVQRFDTDSSGQVVNVVRHAGDLHLECIPVDNLVEATETTMNDPLPDATPDASAPKYSAEVASYLDGYAHREEREMDANLKFAPKETELSHYPTHQAAIWKSVYAAAEAGRQAYHAGQLYVAFRFFSQANASMSGVNAMVGQNRASFDVKAALSESDDLRNHLRTLMNPPRTDRDELQSAVLTAEMADWAYDINAILEGAQLVTKQTFSQRTDATEAERDRARETILFAIEQGKYLLDQADFYHGLVGHIGKDNPIPVDENATSLLPQLDPAQLASARIFTEGLRERANDLRDPLLFDPRLAAYIGVLRETKTEWDAHERKMEMEIHAVAAAQPAASGTAPVKPNADAVSNVAFSPGNTYAPPHTAVAPTLAGKKLSNVALCLIWANSDCEIAALDAKYLRLDGAIDPITKEWRVKDHDKLKALVQSAEIGAREGVTLAEKVGVDSSVLGMIYERAAYLQAQDDDASALEALRNYWRCALIGNMSWQLAHTHKAKPVEVPNDKTPTTAKADDKTKPASNANVATTPSASTNVVVTPAATTNSVTSVPTPASHPAEVIGPPAPTPPATVTNTVTNVEPPVAPIAHGDHQPLRAVPVAPDATNAAPEAIGPPVPATTGNDAEVPVAPIAHPEDDKSGDSGASTNAPPVVRPVHDNADGHGAGAFP